MTAPLSSGSYTDAYMFSGGTHLHDSGVASPYASLVSLQESTLDNNPTFFFSETICTGFARMLWKLLGDRGKTPSNFDFKPLLSVAGKSATTIAQLSKGGSYYSRITDDVTNGKALADAAGKSYGVIGISFDQGADDYTAGTTASAYTASMIQLITDLNTEIKAITGQTQDIYLYVIQDNAHSARSHANDPYLARAQLDAANQDYRIKIAYHQGPNIAGVHYEPYQDYIAGMHLAYAYVRHQVDHNGIASLVPTKVEASGTSGRATFPVDVGYVLGFYSFYPQRQTTYGCRVVQSDGTTARTISPDPVLVNDNCIDFTTTTSMVAGDYFDFGDAASWGNVFQFPSSGQDPADPVFGYSIKQPVLTSRTAITIVGSIPAGTATAPYTLPTYGVPSAPGYTPEQPQVIAGSQLAFLVSADQASSITLNGSNVSALKDFISGVTLVQATAGSQPAYSATGWFDGTACITADGVDDFLRSSGAAFGNLPRDNCKREMWFVADFSGDADTLRECITYGGSAGEYFSIKQVIVSTVLRARLTPSTSSPAATDTTTTLSGRHWIRAYWDGTNLGIQVDGGTVTTTAVSGGLTTNATNLTLFGTTTSGATAFMGKFKKAFIINGILSASPLASMHTYCQSLV